MFPADDLTVSDVTDPLSMDDYGRFMPYLDFSGVLGPEPVLGDAINTFGPRSAFQPPQLPQPPLDYTSEVSTRKPATPRSISPRRLHHADKPRPTRLCTATTPEPASKSRKQQTPPARKSHNQVEKKYRDRLNDQFERLLAALAVSSAQDGEGLDEDGMRPLSKSAVLGLARRRLLALEKENQMLNAEVERLGALLPRVGCR